MGFRVKFLPYCLQPLADGSFVLLNRDYKYVGNLSSSRVSYESSVDRIRFKKNLTPLRISKLDYREKPDSDGVIYFYSDGCVPFSSAKATSDYFQRLAVLDSLEMIPA